MGGRGGGYGPELSPDLPRRPLWKKNEAHLAWPQRTRLRVGADVEGGRADLSSRKAMNIA